MNISLATKILLVSGFSLISSISVSGTKTINGGAGDDDLRGEAGDDIIYTGAGTDTVTGGLGNDTIIIDGL
jgi:Ca2+-binding RTX toxin-like protein